MSEAQRWIALVTFPPDDLAAGLLLLAAIFFLNDLVRTALMPVAPRSIVIHLAVCGLTLLPSFVMSAALIAASRRHPERIALNLGLCAMLHVPWYAGGALTRLVRADSEGADGGWLGVGAVIVFATGVATFLFA